MTADHSTSPGADLPGGAYEIVAIASSAGGVTALSKLLGALPEHFPVPVVIVQHLDRRHETVIAQVLGRRSPMPVKLAVDGAVVDPGTVSIAPPDHHLLVGDGGRLTLTSTELVHFVRPSADLLFESIAGTYGASAIAIVLTGTGSDGAMGVDAVKSRGGTVLCEDPQTCEFSGMPAAAVATGSVDFVLPLADIPSVLVGLVNGRRTG